MTRQDISMLAGALLAAAPFAAQASVGRYQEDPNIYSPDFWNPTATTSACNGFFDGTGRCVPQSQLQEQRQAGGMSSQSQNSQNGGAGGQM